MYTLYYVKKSAKTAAVAGVNETVLYNNRKFESIDKSFKLKKL